MENNKYYTPDITEFRIGFECEIWRNKTTLEIENPLVTDNVEWAKSIIKTPMSGHMINWQNWPSIKYLLKIGSIRCKFLDKEDIESFGFIHDRSYMFNLGQYRLHFIQPDNELDIIHIYDNESNDDTIFLGNIKNKSEFKFILKRLGICQ